MSRQYWILALVLFAVGCDKTYSVKMIKSHYGSEHYKTPQNSQTVLVVYRKGASGHVMEVFCEFPPDLTSAPTPAETATSTQKLADILRRLNSMQRGVDPNTGEQVEPTSVAELDAYTQRHFQMSFKDFERKVNQVTLDGPIHREPTDLQGSNEHGWTGLNKVRVKGKAREWMTGEASYYCEKVE